MTTCWLASDDKWAANVSPGTMKDSESNLAVYRWIAMIEVHFESTQASCSVASNATAVGRQTNKCSETCGMMTSQPARDPSVSIRRIRNGRHM